MPLVYIPDSVYAPAHYQPHHSSPYQQQTYHPAPSPYGLPQQPQVHFGAPPPPPQPTRSAYPDQHYQSSHHIAYPPQQLASYQVDPAESHKQRLLAEFAQSLDQRYPTHPQPHHHHHSLSAASAPSAQQARIEYLEEQLRAEKAESKKLAERTERKAAAKDAAKREREQVELNKIRLQNSQQRQHEQSRRRVVFADAQTTPAAAPPRHRHVVDEEQLVAFLQAQHAQPRPQHQPRFRPQPEQPHPSAPSIDQLTQLLALAQLLEARHSPHPEPTAQPTRAPEVDTPTPTNVAYHYIPHPSARSSSASAPTATAGPSSRPTSSPPPALATAGPTPLARLRLLQSRLNLLTSSTTAVAPAELEKLLAEADELESGGDEEVRGERRGLVTALEAELAKAETTQSGKVEEEMVGSPVVAETAVDEAGQEREKKVEGYAVPDLSAAEEAEEAKEEEAEAELEEVKKVDKGKGRAVTVEDVPEEEQEEGYTVV